MEKNISQTQPIKTTVKTKPWLKIVLFSTLGLVLAGGLVFVGIQIGKKQRQLSVQLTPTPSVVTLLTSTPTVVVTSTPDPTADWKTYTNTRYGYSIKYPDDWFLNFDSPGGQQFSNIKSESPFDTRMRVDANDISREDFKEKYELEVGTKLEVEFKVMEEKIANLTITGKPAVKLIRTPSQGATSPAYIVRILVAKNSEIIEISCWGKNKEDQQKYDAVFNLTLSTFRFLE